MIEPVILAALLATFYIGWNIGSNDTANAMGTAVGARVLSHRRAVVILILFVILGAMLEGYKVMEPVGEGIITSPGSADSPLAAMPQVVVVAMLAAGIWVTLATRFGFPVSTHQAIIGALVGAGIAMAMFTAIATEVNWGKLSIIFMAWALTPVTAAVLALLLYKIFELPLRKVKSIAKINLIFSVAVILSGCYVAYVMGANDVGTAMGAMYATGKESMGAGLVLNLALFGAIAVAIGAITYSRRVMGTVGVGITSLGPMTAFVAQFAAALTVHLFTQWGLPVSTSQAIIGGVVGAGLVRGMTAVRGKKLGKIAATWVATTLAAMLLAFVLTLLIVQF